VRTLQVTVHEVLSKAAVDPLDIVREQTGRAAAADAAARNARLILEGAA
jgi:hypothetical protein